MGSSAKGDDQRDGRTRILDAAFEIVVSSGEAALRFVEVAEQAGVALSVITHHFRTREGLVAAVHARRFAGIVAEDVAKISKLVGASTQKDIAAAVTRLTKEVVDRNRAERRLARVSSIGATHGRPELAAVIAEEATGLLDSLDEAVRGLQADGIVDGGIDARAFATFLQAYTLGMVLADLDTSPPPREEIVHIIERAIGAFLI